VGRLGVARETLREIRQELLREGVDWVTSGNRVVLNRDAVKRVIGRLEVLGVVGSADGAKKRAAGDLAEQGEGTMNEVMVGHPVAEMRVVKRVANPNMVLATDGSTLYRVRGRHAGERLKTGMKIRARHVQADLWELKP
jgi:hypothetical protein